MKKILFVLPSLGYGGLERVQVNLANALVRRGYDVTILTYKKGNDLIELLDKKVKYIYKEQKQFNFLRKIRYIRNFYEEGMWERRSGPRKLYKYYIGDAEYDVEIGFFRGLSIKIISGSTNKKSIKLAWVHSDFLKCTGITNSFSDFKKVINAYSIFNQIVCVSKQAAESFIQKIGFRDKVVVIHNINPVNEIRKQGNEVYQNKIKKYFNIVSVGRIVNEAKGFDRLLKACKALNDDNLEYGLTIVGDGKDRAQLQEYITLNNLSNVQLVGMQSNPYKYIKNADLLVCSSYFEGYNLTIAESLILGTPVLSTNCAGPNEILDNGKYGMIVDNSVEGLYEGIKRLITDKKIYEYYKQKANERSDFFDEDNIVSKVESLF